MCEIMFAVNLIEVPPLGKMTGAEVFDLMVNARHVAGRFWFFEGDTDALLASVTTKAVGVSGGMGDLDDERLIAHCADVFGVDLKGEPRSWEMV